MEPVKELLSRQMTRQEFLKVAVVAILTLIGVGNFMNLMKSHSRQSSQPASIDTTNQNGFGSRKFGA